MWFQQRFLVFPFIGDERGHQTLVFWQQQCMPGWRLQRTLVQCDGNPIRPRINTDGLPETLQRFLSALEMDLSPGYQID